MKRKAQSKGKREDLAGQIGKVAAILKRAAKGRAGPAELAEAAGLSESQMYRTLNSMRAAGIIVTWEVGGYVVEDAGPFKS